MSKVTEPTRSGPASSSEEQHEAHAGKRQPGHEEQPARREQQHEAQMAPAVAPAAQMRWPRAAIGAERHRHLGETQARHRGPHHHLGGDTPSPGSAGPGPRPRRAGTRAGRNAGRARARRRTAGPGPTAPDCRSSDASRAWHPAGSPRHPRAGGSPSPSRPRRRDARGTGAARRSHRSRRRRPSGHSGRGQPRSRRPAPCHNHARRPATTRAPWAVASTCEPSVLPLSATSTSPATPARARAALACMTQSAIVSASLRQGISKVTSSSACSYGRSRSSTCKVVRTLPPPRASTARHAETRFNPSSSLHQLLPTVNSSSL